ncbi:MAG: S9 family peptidase [Chloroflexota bacterium]
MTQTKIYPPVAKKHGHVDIRHGDIRNDDYFWLRERESDDVLAYLQAENKYTDAMMAHTEVLQDTLYQEMVGRIQETDTAVPEKIDDYYYYTRTQEGQEYPIHCRKKGNLDAEEVILLDENQMALGQDYCKIGVFEVSPNHQILAYSVDNDGSEVFTTFFKNLETGQLYPDQISGTYYSSAWGNDNQTYFYDVIDEAHRPYQLFRHTLGSDTAADVLVYEEPDEAYNLAVDKTRSQAFILLILNSVKTSEVHYLDANTPNANFRVIHAREQGIEYTVSHHGSYFYIVTNDQAINFRLMTAPINNPAKENWHEQAPHRRDIKLDRVHLFKNHLVLMERQNGFRAIQITNLTTQESHYIDFPEPVYAVYEEANDDFNTQTFRFEYTSLVTPDSIFDYDMDTRTQTLMKQRPVLGGYDPNKYESVRTYAIARDGTPVPMSLVYKKGTVFNGENGCLLQAYGSYGVCSDPYFSSSRLSLLNRGFVIAIAHIRGGGEMGRPWYENGKFFHKQNTFYDFIACAEALIQTKVTSPSHLAIQGGSAGGLLMGAVINLRPDLFKAVVAAVPFVDVINTMLDSSIPLTVGEYEEWGNPNEEDYYYYMKAYSPYDQVEAKDYPHLLITSGLNDPRVQFWEPTKWTAKLRATKTDQNRLLLKTEMGAGHGGPSGRYEALKETAFEYAFILDILG